MNTRRNAARRVEEVAVVENQAPSQAPFAAEQVTANPDRLTDAREGAPRENPNASTMVSRLREFARVNPRVYYGSKANEDPQEFVDEVHKILCAMRVDEEAKAELTEYQLKDVAQVWYRI
ncbi:hypothetical protein EJD97_003116 [Solanum chilense]|uniref:Gag-pol polyprotein n=1 Tax=Solanum chilense TaxID=4083 RepID=A0A6N2AMX3_SOLCI|nr:hypothetical protein EJD97_003116 [Solanum chilense]